MRVEHTDRLDIGWCRWPVHALETPYARSLAVAGREIRTPKPKRQAQA